MAASRVDGEVRDLWRRYTLCKMMRCTPSELDEQPAHVLDWFSAFEEMVNEIQAEASK